MKKIIIALLLSNSISAKIFTQTTQTLVSRSVVDDKRNDFNVGGGLTTTFVSDEVQIRVTGEFGKNLQTGRQKQNKKMTRLSHCARAMLI